MSGQTPSQTVGPFFRIGLIRPGDDMNVLVNDSTAGQRILVRGSVIDGDGEPIPDAMVELWQADANGIYPHPADSRHQQADPNFHGFGRSEIDETNEFVFKTVKPGAVETDSAAPHLNLRVFARGMLIHAYTRMYFPDEPGNEQDPTLNQVEAARRSTLIASQSSADDLPTYHFDIVLQGDQETVFFDL